MKFKKVTLTAIVSAILAASPGCGGGGGGGGGSNPPNYATEVEGDNQLADTADAYLAGSEIESYRSNPLVDVVGNQFRVDLEVVLSDGRTILIWYQGENDGEHLDEKGFIESKNDVYWVQINPCPKEDIPGTLDEINIVHDWAQGEY
ncbi:hypothetical protein GOV06_02690 [Candidatus Woesearchaeota archaeon]|nr:hypothetical protein [Candidatus Woesearchaeota archaeon]